MLVIGGGPAGSAAALTLQRYTKHRLLLAEGGRNDSSRLGETVSSSVLAQLAYLGAASVPARSGALEAFSTAAAWGRSDIAVRDSVFTPSGRGLLLDRRRFDAALRGTFESDGGTLLQGTLLRAVEETSEGWYVTFDRRSEELSVAATQVVDATGRRAAFARRAGASGRRVDKLVSVVAHFRQAPQRQMSQSGLIESVPDGWWYSAPGSAEWVVVAFMTDADLHSPSSLSSPEALLRRLDQTVHTRQRLEHCTLAGKTAVHLADTRVLEPLLGRAWVSAGDVSAAFDPLSSLGVGHALASGIQAARIADERLRGEDALASAYPLDVARHVDAYLAERAHLYGLERRWPDSQFWRRRRHAPAALSTDRCNTAT